MGIGLGNLNGPEYEARWVVVHSATVSWLVDRASTRLRKPFVPPSVTLKDIHAAVPKHLLRSESPAPMS